MRKKRLQTKIMAGRFTLPVIVLLCTVVWCVTGYFLQSNIEQVGARTASSEFIRTYFNVETKGWISSAIAFLLYSVTAYFLLIINNRLNIVRNITSAVTYVYLVLIAVSPQTHYLTDAAVASPMVALSLYYLLKTYQQEDYSSANLFYSFFYMGLSSILVPQILFVFPVMIHACYILRSLNIRSLFASITGLVLPYWLLFAHAMWHDKTDKITTLTELNHGINNLFAISDIPHRELATLAFIFLFLFIAFINIQVNEHDEKIITRAYLSSISNISLFLFVICLAVSYNTNETTIILTPYASFIISHLFATTSSKRTNILFMLFILSLLTVLSFNTWTLL